MVSILLPTYNRGVFLEKNINLLISFIDEAKFHDIIEIIISNNNSTDNTNIILKNLSKKNPRIKLSYFNQKENIGLEKNALFVLKEASAKFVMYLGDDDFIDLGYLKSVVKHLENNDSTNCIIPSFTTIDLNGNRIKGERDLNKPNILYDAGFDNCLENSWRGHQLSGLVFKRDGLYKSYMQNEINNIYLFIYFTSISCLTGKTFHLTTNPVAITSPGQENKDWNYGEDGLVNEIFDNYNKLPLNEFQKTLLQLKIIRTQPTRIWSYKNKGFKTFIIAIKNIWFSKKSTFLFKLTFPFEFLRQVLYRLLYK